MTHSSMFSFASR